LLTGDERLLERLSALSRELDPVPVPVTKAAHAVYRERPRRLCTGTKGGEQMEEGAVMTPPASAGDVVKTATNGMAVASLVLGIVWLGGLGAVLALIFGIKARRQIDLARGAQGGRGLAIAGIVLGIVGIVGALIYWPLVAFAATHASNAGAY
jgi:hypothetical protein